MKNLKQYKKYNEYLEIVTKMSKDKDINIFKQSWEDTGRAIKKYLKDIEKDSVIVNIKINFNNKIKLNIKQKRDLKKILKNMDFNLNKNTLGYENFIDNFVRNKDVLLDYPDYQNVMRFYLNIIENKKKYEQIINLNILKISENILDIIFNKKDKEIYKNNIEIVKLFKYEDNYIEMSNKIDLILTILNHSEKHWEIYKWADGIRIELERVTGINIFEFGVLAERLFFDNNYINNKSEYVENWYLVKEVSKITNDFEIINNIASLNRSIVLLKLELEKEKNKKKKWF